MNDKKKHNQALVRGIRLLFLVIIFSGLITILIRQYLYVFSDQAVINTEIISMGSATNGELVIDDAFQPGAVVAKQTILFKIVNPRFGNTTSAAQFNLLQIHIDSIKEERLVLKKVKKKCRKDVERFRALLPSGAVSQREVEAVENELEVINAQIQSKKVQLSHLRKRFSEASEQLQLYKESIVKMPFDGIIWTQLKKNREMVDINDDVIQIINSSNIWVDAFFHEKHSNIIRPGVKVTVKEVGGERRSWTGEVMFVRAGVGRFEFNESIEIPPELLRRRVVAARIKVDWHEVFSSAEFGGVGRSVTVSIGNGIFHSQNNMR